MSVIRLLAWLWLLFAAQAVGAADPLLQGRPLSFWLLLLHENEYRLPYAEGDSGILRARLALGDLDADSAPTAVPHLLAWYAERPHPDPDQLVNRAFLQHVLARAGSAARPALPLLASFQPRSFAEGPQHWQPEKVDPVLRALDPALHDRLLCRATPADVPLLLRQLETGDDLSRCRAAELLIEATPTKAGPALPVLSRTLLDPDWIVPPGHVPPELLLARMGEMAQAAVPLLVYRLLKEGSVSCASALAVLDPKVALEQLRRQPVALRQRVLRELVDRRLTASVPLIVGLLRDAETTLAATEALAVLDPRAAVAALPAVVAGLKAPEAALRLRWAALLPQLDAAKNADGVAVLRGLLRADQLSERAAALKLLPQFGKAAVPAWIDLLGDERWGQLALETLPRFGSDAVAAAPALKKLLRHQDKSQAVRAAWALAWIEPSALKEEIATLKEAVAEEGGATRELALMTLGHFGDGRLAPDFVDRLRLRGNPGEVAAAVYALRRLGKEAVPALVAGLQDAEPQIQGNAARTLADLGPVARAAVPALRDLGRKKPGVLRQRTAEALARIDPQGEGQAAVAALEDAAEYVSRTGEAAAISLGRLARDRDLAPELFRLLRTAKPDRSGLAFCAAGPRADLVPGLKKHLLPADNTPLHPVLLRALSAYGPAANALIPAVLPSWRDPETRPLVEETLAALGTPQLADVEPWLLLLRDRAVRPRALAVLRHLGKAAGPLVEKLLADDDFDALAGLLPPRELVLARLKGKQWETLWDHRIGSYSEQDAALVRAGGAELVRDLSKLLEKKPVEVDRLLLLHALSLAGDVAVDAVPHFRAALKEKLLSHEAIIVVPAAWRLRTLGIPDAEFVPLLRSMLTRPSQWLSRTWAAERLSDLGKTALPAEPELREIIKTYPDNSAAWAVRALIGMNRADIALARIPIKLLSEGGRVDAELVLDTLGLFGSLASSASDELAKRLAAALVDQRTSDADLVPLVRALIRIDPPRTKAVRLMLTQHLGKRPRACALALAELGERGRPAVPELIDRYRRLHHDNGGTTLLQALAVLGPDSKARVEALASSAPGGFPDCDILGVWGARAKEAVPALVRLLAAELDDVELGFEGAKIRRNCRVLAETLGKIGPEAQAAVAVLKRMHQRREPELYLTAARALRQIDAEAARALGIPEPTLR